MVVQDTGTVEDMLREYRRCGHPLIEQFCEEIEEYRDRIECLENDLREERDEVNSFDCPECATAEAENDRLQKRIAELATELADVRQSKKTNGKPMLEEQLQALTAAVTRQNEINTQLLEVNERLARALSHRAAVGAAPAELIAPQVSPDGLAEEIEEAGIDAEDWSEGDAAGTDAEQNVDPEPELEEAAAAEDLTEDDLRVALMAHQKATSRDATEAVVKKFIKKGQPLRIQSVPKDRYGALIAELKAAA